MYDVVIKNAKIIDGTGALPFFGDLALEGSRIAVLSPAGRLGEGRRILEGDGLVLAPGFIDIHTHSDLMALEGKVTEKIRQGITTEIVGNCGFSVAPIPQKMAGLAEEFLFPVLGQRNPCCWENFQGYLDTLQQKPLLLHIGSLVGQGSLRLGHMGFSGEPVSAGALQAMKEGLDHSLQQGAWGLSSGLIYPPGCYASFSELKELCKVAAAHGVPYVTHIRSEAASVLEGVEEALKLGYETGVPIHFSHHQIDGRANWGKAEQTLALMAKGRQEGLQVTLDQYPYQAGSTMLLALLPPWLLDQGREKALIRLQEDEVRSRLQREYDGGERDLLVTETGWEHIMLNSLPETREWEQKNLSEIADMQGKTEVDTLLDLIVANGGGGTVVLFDQGLEDWERIFQDPYCSIATDSILVGQKPHPRSLGTFPRVLGNLVREQGLLTLEAAVRKMTGLPAATFKIPGRGLIGQGYKGDLILFDEERIGFQGTFQNPRQEPQGIEYVLVDGQIVLEQGVLTEARPGQVLRRP